MWSRIIINIYLFNFGFLIFLATVTRSMYTPRRLRALRDHGGQLTHPDVMPDDFYATRDSNGSTAPPKGSGAQQEMERFTIPSTTLKRFARTTPLRISFEENCDYLAYYCLKAYTTGKLCGRTLYYTYHTFKNYCLLDYVNCMERYEVWQVVHMGECFNVTELTEYLLYPYDDDFFLDHYYVMEDH